MTGQHYIWYIAYCLVLAGLAGYGFHRLVIVYLYLKNVKNKPQPKAPFKELPLVTIQLPVFNERYVVERLIRSVAELDYPKDKMEIQVLDDSTDDTTEICREQVEQLKSEGFDAVLLHRTDRTGFKAGALEEATKVAKGEYLFILDADFVPEKDVLLRTVHFFSDDKIGMVQTRWGHINRCYNVLTRVQAMFLDGHLQLEQTARNRSGRFFTFNGTAGIWRKSCIAEAGGWEHDTLTEDMDLSYRAQLKGWKFIFLNDVVTPAELPVDMNGFKAQQHRWTKGSIQVCQKILLDIWKAKVPLVCKLEATAHLTSNYAYLLLIVLCFLLYPAQTGHQLGSWVGLLVNITLFFFASVSVALFYIVAQQAIRPKSWWKEIFYLPVLLALGVGMAVNNAKAVLEAVIGHQSGFVRTPKYGVGAAKDGGKAPAAWRKSSYKALKSFLIPLVEFGFGCFFLWVVIEALLGGRYGTAVLLTPFLGFFYTSLGSLAQAVGNLLPVKDSKESNA